MRLLRVELTRFRARGAVRWTALGLLVVTMLLVFVAFTQARPMPAEEQAQMRALFEDQVDLLRSTGRQPAVAPQRLEEADGGVVIFGMVHPNSPQRRRISRKP